MFFTLLFLLVFVNCVFGTEIPCIYNPDLHGTSSCVADQSANIQVTTQNEPITVTTTGNPPGGLSYYRSIYFQSPHVLNFIPSNMFAQLPNLKTFQAESVQFSTMTENAFINCDLLEDISLYNNGFSSITARFAKTCTAVIKIDFEHNELTNFDKDALEGLVNLNWLQLQHNQISSLHPMTFIHTPNLKYLMINDNMLSSIDPNLFAILSPSEIHLHNNFIARLPALAFASTSNLNKLLIGNNKITAIEKQLFVNYIQTGRPYTIDLDSNICISGVFYDPAMPNLLDYLYDCYTNFDPSLTTTTTSLSTTAFLTTTLSEPEPEVTTTLQPVQPTTPTKPCDSYESWLFYFSL
jgi:hypothetical protein